MTEHLHFHFSLSCIGEGNGNPLQCSCLENPRDGEAWWAAVYGVAQSQTRVKWLNSSSSSSSWVNEAMFGLCVWSTCVLMDEKSQFLPLPTPAAHGESRFVAEKGRAFLSCITEKLSAAVHRLWYQGSISWKTIFPRPGEGWFEDASSELHLLCTLFLLSWHQLHLRSSGIKSQRLGTPGLVHSRSVLMVRKLPIVKLWKISRFHLMII